MPPMKRVVPAVDAEAYVAALDGWRRDIVARLRALVRATPGLGEGIRWSHIVYRANGPVLLIRAEEARVLFGFWRGKRLRAIEPRLKPGGKYELATATFVEGSAIDDEVVRALVSEAVRLDAELGDPTRIG
ncbi:DUF1801 domain-containing protein [Dokdonella sp. MW10]|uniref:DUF1801 domain-containing protein n=1 Tax=Dokdonella sp. MW10 TaxID=2992926 RepID=UPI003F7D4C88